MVIINADDFGLSQSVNNAIVECFAKGYINRTTIMTNMPCSNFCYSLAIANGFLPNVGLHLVLDEGEPLSEKIKDNKKFCKDGQFIRGWFAKPINKIYLSRYDMNCLKEEIEAQMFRYREMGFILKHLDSHHFVHTSSPLLTNLICRLAHEHGFTSMRTVAYSPNEGAIKRAIKVIIKNTIQGQFETTKYFAHYYLRNSSVDDIEYMTHPDIIDGCTVDVINRKTNTVKPFELNVSS